MRVGERGQVTIPKAIRDRFGIDANADVEFEVVDGVIVLKKTRRKLNFEKWKGRCKRSFRKLGYSSVDRFMEDVRGR
jgi:AbrB family looped-hinge helix DNA binding protein